MTSPVAIVTTVNVVEPEMKESAFLLTVEHC